MKRVSRRHIVLGLMLCGAIAYLALVMRAPTRPASGTQPQDAAAAEEETGKGDAETGALKLPEPADFARYQGTIGRNIFAPPAPPKPPATRRVLPPPPLSDVPKPPTAPRQKPPDLSGWSYMGYMVIGDQLIGVLQNEGNDSMKELPLGSEFLGAEVQSITSEEIVFDSPGGTVRLSTPRDFPVVSLSKSSAGAPSRPPRPPAAPPQPQPQPQAPPSPPTEDRS